MCFAESGTAVNVKRIVNFAGLFGNRQSRSMCGIVVLTDNERIERLFSLADLR